MKKTIITSAITSVFTVFALHAFWWAVIVGAVLAYQAVGWRTVNFGKELTPQDGPPPLSVYLIIGWFWPLVLCIEEFTDDDRKCVKKALGLDGFKFQSPIVREEEPNKEAPEMPE